MCIFSKPDLPKPKPVPRTPTPDDDAVRNREREERARLAASSGRAATVLTGDLAPSAISGQKRVLLGV